MALIDIDPSIVGAFVPTDALLEHKDTIGTAFWNQFVENGIAAYSLWRGALTMGVSVWGSDLFCQIPPVNPSTYYANIEYTENAAIRIGFTWAGDVSRGTVVLYGGTNVASMGSLWKYEISATTGSYFGLVADPIVVPEYGSSVGLIKTLPYFLKVVSTTPGNIAFTSMDILYKKYPVFSSL